MHKQPADEVPVVYGAAWLDSHSLRTVVTFAFRRGVQIAVVFGIAFLPIIIGPMIREPTFESKAGILVTTVRAEVALTPTESNQMITVRPVSESDLSTEIEILKSTELAERVVTALVASGAIVPDADPGIAALEPEPGVMTIAIGSAEVAPPALSAVAFAESVLSIETGASFRAVGQSAAIEIVFRSTDAQYSYDVINAILDAYLDRRTEVFRMSRVVSFFVTEKEAARQRLDARSDELRDYGEIIGFPLVDIPGEKGPAEALEEMLIGKLGDLEANLAQAEVSARGTGERSAALERELGRHPQAGTALRIDEIRAQMADLRLQRDIFVQQTELDHEMIDKIGDRIVVAVWRMRELQLGLSDSESQRLDLLKAQLSNSRAELAATEARRIALVAQVLTTRRELDALAGASSKIADLHREIRIAEAEYLLYGKKHEEARISAAMDLSRLVNVTVSQRPRGPAAEPVRQRTAQGAALAVIMGLVCAFGLALTRDFYDHTFATGDAVEHGLGVPHLASIPEGYDGAPGQLA